jgi:hypothetical protein
MGVYDKYDENGKMVGDESIIFAIDPDEIFGKTAE